MLIKGGESNFNIYTGPGEGHSMALVARNGPFQEYVLCPPVSLFFVLYFPPPYLDQLRLLVCQPVSKGFHHYLGTMLVCIEFRLMLSTIKFLYILLIVCLTKPSYTFATSYPRYLTLSPTFIFPYFSCLPKGGERRVGERGEVGEKGG